VQRAIAPGKKTEVADKARNDFGALRKCQLRGIRGEFGGEPDNRVSNAGPLDIKVSRMTARWGGWLENYLSPLRDPSREKMVEKAKNMHPPILRGPNSVEHCGKGGKTELKCSGLGTSWFEGGNSKHSKPHPEKKNDFHSGSSNMFECETRPAFVGKIWSKDRRNGGKKET